MRPVVRLGSARRLGSKHGEWAGAADRLRREGAAPLRKMFRLQKRNAVDESWRRVAGTTDQVAFNSVCTAQKKTPQEGCSCS